MNRGIIYAFGLKVRWKFFCGNCIYENKKIVIYLVYKPPRTPSVEFLDLFDDYLCKLLSVKNECTIMGDFNFDLLFE